MSKRATECLIEAASRALEAAGTRQRERLGNSLLVLAGSQNIIRARLWRVVADEGPSALAAVDIHRLHVSFLHRHEE